MVIIKYVADYQHWATGVVGVVFDAVYGPLRSVVGHAVAWFVAEVLSDVFAWLCLERVAFLVAEREIRERWAEEDRLG